MTRAPMLNYATTTYPCLGLTPATERWDGRPSHALHAHHPHTRAALMSSARHYPARLSAAQWSQTHSGSFQTLGGVVALRQSPAGQLIQPADRWFCSQNSKSHFPLSYILTGISHRVWGAYSDCRNGFSGVELPRCRTLVVTRYS